MDLTSRIEANDVLIINLREESLDAGNVHDFREIAHTMIKSRTRVVLDLSDVRFVDSSGLGAMISCQRILNARHGDFRLCGMSKTVQALFELMRMHRIFHIHSTRQEAIGAFNSVFAN